MARYRYYRSYRSSQASAHIDARTRLSAAFGGIDKDIEKIFLNLPSNKLESVFLRYGKMAGASPESYARQTYQKWKRGSVKMSGVVAERLLNLVPQVLDSNTRFELVKKLRASKFRKTQHNVAASPTDWRSKVMPLINQLVADGNSFQLPADIVARVQWLSEGDAVAAQKLLAAADHEEASIRLSYLDSEFRRIEALVSTIATSHKIVHTICLPQGDVTVTIATPKKSFWSFLFGS